MVFKSGPGDAGVEHLGNVEAALLGKQAFVFVELFHFQDGAEVQPSTQGVSEFALPADLQAVAPGFVGAVVGQGIRV